MTVSISSATFLEVQPISLSLDLISQQFPEETAGKKRIWLTGSAILLIRPAGIAFDDSLPPVHSANAIRAQFAGLQAP
jgi:hypothetical protein